MYFEDYFRSDAGDKGRAQAIVQATGMCYSKQQRDLSRQMREPTAKHIGRNFRMMLT